MKVLVGFILGIVAVLGIAACALSTAVVPTQVAPTQLNVQAQLPTVPPLQPVAAQAANNPDMTITLSERYLNQKLSAGMPQGGEVSNATLDFHADNLADFSATVKTGLVNVQPKASVRFSVQNTRIVIDVLKVDVGGFGVPSSMIQPQVDQLKQTAETELNRQFADIQSSTGLKLDSLSTTENSLSLYFVQ